MFYYLYFLLYQKIIKKHFLIQNNYVNTNFLALFFKLVCSDICIKNNVIKSDSILVNETMTLCNE